MNANRLNLRSLKPAFFLHFLLLFSGINAQILRINCIDPKEVVLPLQGKPTEYINYTGHEDYTYWYEIDIQDNCKFSYTVSGLESGTSFQAELYEYSGSAFCRQLVKEELEPLHQGISHSLKIKKDTRLYLGINSLGSDCGHRLTLVTDRQEEPLVLNVALHGSPCAQKLEYNRPDPPEETAKTEMADVVVGVPLTGNVLNSLTGGKINGDLELIHKKEGYQVDAISYRLHGYNVKLEKGARYSVHVSAMGYIPMDTVISVSNPTVMDFRLKPAATGEKFIVENIYFYPNTFACKPESQRALEALRDYMLENKRMMIEIQGHTNGNKDIRRNKNNEKLGEEWNYEGTARELSRLRAEKLKEYLVENGVSRKRIETIGKGGDEMIVPDPKDMEEAAKNIRVEIRILGD